MGKRKSIRSSVTSKGERRSIVAGVKEVRRSKSPLDRAFDKLTAWQKGKNPWVSVDTMVKGSNKRFIRVKANTLWGDPKKIQRGEF